MIQEFPDLEIHMKENLDHPVDGELLYHTLQDLLHYPVGTDGGGDCIECDYATVAVEAFVR